MVGRAPVAVMFIEGTVVFVTIITPSKIRSHRYDLKLRLLLVYNLCQVNSFLGSKLDYMVDSERKDLDHRRVTVYFQF